MGRHVQQMLVDARAFRAASAYATDVRRRANGDRLVRWAILAGFLFLLVLLYQGRARGA